MLLPASPIAALGPIARTVEKPLKRLGIATIQDLLFYFPYRYEDWTHVVSIQDLKQGDPATVRGRVEQIVNRRSWKRRMVITEAIIRDDTGLMKVGWFYQPYLVHTLKPGDELYCAGMVQVKGQWHMVSPVFEKVPKDANGTMHTARIVPVYPATDKLTQKQIRFLMRRALGAAEGVEEWLPTSTLEQYRFPSIATALEEIHFPSTSAALDLARHRFKFEELLLIQLYAGTIRNSLEKSKAISVPFNKARTQAFVEGLPFKLTEDQRRAGWDILQDLEKPHPMNRLLQGEVGSGKTMVAALAIVNAAASGAQSALLAPTELLATQHYRTLSKFLTPHGVRVAIHTRTERSHGPFDCVVGTHALLEESIQFDRLALAIVDEQHRFGVGQRKGIRDRSSTIHVPHLLSMSATPIPRTLALAFFGDLDISEIRQLPVGRRAIATEVCTEKDREKVYGAMRQAVSEGFRVYVVCPLIDPSDTLGVRSVTEEQKRLGEVFAAKKIGLLHGRLKPDERDRMMELFRDGEVLMLVATTVIEVGVDVPEATLMVIEAGERFGLAQLHQLRGRVGRGEHQGRCMVMMQEVSAHAAARLKAFTECQDGFDLAERDLALRGPGELWGTAQTGFPEFKIASVKDVTIIQEAKQEAREILKDGIDKVPLVKKKLSEFIRNLQSG